MEAKGEYGIYNDEVMNFQEKFLYDDKLESLDKLSPNMCIKSLFDTASITLYLSKRAVVMPTQLNTNKFKNATKEYPDKSLSGMEKYVHYNFSYIIINLKYYDIILKELDADKIYKKLNDNKDIKKYCSDCNDVLSLEETYPEIIVLCKNLAKNLRKTMSDVEDDVTNVSDRCLYFIHWTYGELKKNILYKFEIYS
ncbi:hypothetical protein PCYB_005430 [Plasmodium cynomolgi strain B]|uniref:CYIR protein n=1 Tax=Plasmodium cynomolgi (strain B) TaxID=1120755 RepID=K6V0E6_PLACD|nr:hypothetical protein PCYB_005430 [Plasmodium cynomolgi strain B]GAB69794.1 hypothetical protein PCYB_005430 [Plasmodium cynomolgi strain B]